jgi:hypothetical protein
VEVAGQLVHIFQCGLDYTFIPLPGCGACYPRLYLPRILVPAHVPLGLQPAYESLQGRPEVGPLPTPRCCRSGLPRARVHRCEPRFHSALAGRGDHVVNRTRVRQPSIVRSTCLARSLVFDAGYPTGRERRHLAPWGFRFHKVDVWVRSYGRLPVRRSPGLSGEGVVVVVRN